MRKSDITHEQVIHQRYKEKQLEEHEPKEQAEFTNGYSTIDHFKL